MGIKRNAYTFSSIISNEIYLFHGEFLEWLE